MAVKKKVAPSKAFVYMCSQGYIYSDMAQDSIEKVVAELVQDGAYGYEDPIPIYELVFVGNYQAKTVAEKVN